ncbi:L,D-transpeptidase [Kocuria rhizosphaericola]|uniref:L,D-transpeptidase n=1 Tax=Kocuria rhizosphaericola TaxID=3376284 RepID=UPI0037AB8901
MPLSTCPDPALPAPRPAPALRRLLSLGAVTVLLATGCGQASGALAGEPAAPASSSSTSPSSTSPSSTSPSSTSPPSTGRPATAAPAEVAVAPADAAVEHNPVEPVVVRADRGELTDVVLVPAPGGDPVPGELSADGRTWTSTEVLDFDTPYELHWSATSGAVSTTGTSTFATVLAANEVDARLNVVDGGVYGTGQVLQFTFSEPVANKEQVEEAVTVDGGGDRAGAFRWYSDTMVRYRPAEKWAPRAEITVSLDLLGLDVGHGMVGNHDLRRSFSTGAEHYARVDNGTKTLTAYVDGKVAGTYPVTLGNADWPSTTGQKVIMEQAPEYLFTASSLDLQPGDPHWYETFWASNVSRLTASGEFVHQALPSAMPVLGIANVSHGCVGMPPEGAKFIHDVFRPGDVVEVVGTGYPQADPDDGFGDWNIPLEHYADEDWQGDW